MQTWIKNYFNTLRDLQLNTRVTQPFGKLVSMEDGFKQAIQSIKTSHHQGGKLMIIGNGGSAGISSHLAIDYCKNGKLRASAFNDPSALTCLSNDYGYEHVFAKQIEFHGDKKDVLLAISSSGRSKNILNAIEVASKMNCKIITFTGFDPANPMNEMGDVNFYIDSKSYGFVEVAHLGLGHAMLDYIIEEQCAQTQQRSTEVMV